MVSYTNETDILQVVYDYLHHPYRVPPGETITYQATELGGLSPSGYTGASYQYPRLDPSSFALLTLNHAASEIHEGHSFAVHIHEEVFDKASELGILFKTPNTANRLHAVSMVYCGAAAVFDVCEAPTIDTGNYPTAFSIPRNRKRNSSIASGILSVRAVPVVNQASLKRKADTTPISGDGTVIHAEMIGSGKQGGGSGTRENDEYLLKPNTIYYFRLKGSVGGADGAAASMAVTWFEHTDLE